MNNFKFLEMRVDKLGIKKMTQDELSSVLNIERSRIQALEKSPKVIPKYEELKAYCDYFQTTSDYLLGITTAKPIDENINMISRTTGLSDASINKLKNCTDLQRNIIDKLLSSNAIDKIVSSYICKNSQFFQTIEIVDNIYGRRTASDEETKNFHLFQSVELLKDALNILNDDMELFYKLNHSHTETQNVHLIKMLVNEQIEHLGTQKAIDNIKRYKKNIPKEVLDYIEEITQKESDD